MTYEGLLDARDWAERAVHELSEELRDYDDESPEWETCQQELNEAENELAYLQERLDTGDYED